MFGKQVVVIINLPILYTITLLREMKFTSYYNTRVQTKNEKINNVSDRVVRCRRRRFF